MSKTFRGDSAGTWVFNFILALPLDFFTVAALLLLVCGLSVLPHPRPWLRWTALLGGYLLFGVLVSVTFANEEFYASFGSPLKYHLVALAPAVGRELLRSGISRNLAGVIGPLVLIVISLAVSPSLCARVQPAAFVAYRKKMLIAMLAAALIGGGLYLKPPENMRALALRDLSLVTLFKAEVNGGAEIAPPSRTELKMLADLAGTENTEGAQAFSVLKKRKFNIVVWVWESVGVRYLKSYHPLGVARTPNLDRLTAAGSVNFTDCHCESPLTVQTGWALDTGTSPPARPIMFLAGKTLPEHAPFLPALFKANDYQTVHLNASHLSVWNMQRFLSESGYDVLEDSDRVSDEQRQKYALNEWGIQDKFLVDRFGEYLDAMPKSKPLFAMLWNIETHHPYVRHDMPAELYNASDYDRYVSGIEESDATLGKIYDLLAKHDMAENTIFVVIGDHGEGVGRPPRSYERSHSMLVFEDSTHVPLFFINPAFKQMQSVSAPCGPVDLYPTLLDLANLPPVQDVAGTSLARTVPPRILYSRSIVWWPVCVRAGPYKLILGAPEQSPELYNIHADPTESNDLAATQMDITHVLTAALLRMSADRYKNDPSFEYGFSMFQSASGSGAPVSKRPPVSDLLK